MKVENIILATQINLRRGAKLFPSPLEQGTGVGVNDP
jgi:hypothetical protein